ncbi:nucleotidyltransferase family protein [Pararhizobium arenae]|uniref:nucleotidyltransferase family protein n=1 Tax=Pararhizobium arenae TaxID=1856850 RepID=UPI00094B54C3|nr:nucleotidyltransferase domain-containing protein [Pararhizobium arenae]
MSKAETIEKLRQHAEAMKGMGATALYLFGSVGRNEADASSDIDLFIDYDSERRFSLLDLVEIKQYLEERFQLDIDVTTRSSLHPMLRDDIKRSAIRIF